jgi:hypothetical protein
MLCVPLQDLMAGGRSQRPVLVGFDAEGADAVIGDAI